MCKIYSHTLHTTLCVDQSNRKIPKTQRDVSLGILALIMFVSYTIFQLATPTDSLCVCVCQGVFCVVLTLSLLRTVCISCLIGTPCGSPAVSLPPVQPIRAQAWRRPVIGGGQLVLIKAAVKNMEFCCGSASLQMIVSSPPLSVWTLIGSLRCVQVFAERFLFPKETETLRSSAAAAQCVYVLTLPAGSSSGTPVLTGENCGGFKNGVYNSPRAPWQMSVLVAPPRMNSGLETSSWGDGGGDRPV